MIDLRYNNCKTYFSILEMRNSILLCPQCNTQVSIARLRNYSTNNSEIFKDKENPRLSKAIFSDE